MIHIKMISDGQVMDRWWIEETAHIEHQLYGTLWSIRHQKRHKNC